MITDKADVMFGRGRPSNNESLINVVILGRNSVVSDGVRVLVGRTSIAEVLPRVWVEQKCQRREHDKKVDCHDVGDRGGVARRMVVVDDGVDDSADTGTEKNKESRVDDNKTHLFHASTIAVTSDPHHLHGATKHYGHDQKHRQ